MARTSSAAGVAVIVEVVKRARMVVMASPPVTKRGSGEVVSTWGVASVLEDGSSNKCILAFFI